MLYSFLGDLKEVRGGKSEVCFWGVFFGSFGRLHIYGALLGGFNAELESNEDSLRCRADFSTFSSFMKLELFLPTSLRAAFPAHETGRRFPPPQTLIWLNSQTTLRLF